MAFKGFGIWSLIAQPLLVRVSSTLFFWFSTEWRPRFELVFHKIKELYFFGMKKLLVNLVNFTLSNIDFFLIGKFLGAYALGLYTLAFRIMKAPFNKIAAVINGVLFPAYSVIQDDVVRFNKNYLRSTTAISCIIVPILIFISFNSKEIILLLFGEKWIASAPILMILCCAEMVEIFSFSDQSAIIAKGEPAYLVKINLIILFFIGAGIYLGSRYGIIVVASVYTVSIAIGSSVKKAIVLRKLGISFKNFYFSIRPIIISSVFIILSLLISGPLADRYLSISALMRLLVSGAVCAFVYCVLLFMTNIVRMENGKINLII
jgi:O-antigen/teichoic acid export membrane protein